MESNIPKTYKPIELHQTWERERTQLRLIEIKPSPLPILFMTQIERLRVQTELDNQTMQRINEEKTRIAEQMHGLALAIIASQTASGKNDMFLQPCRRCTDGCCI